MKSPIAVVVLAAGAGTRMKSSLPKVLHPLAGWPMVRHVLQTAARLKAARIVGVVAPGAKAVAQAFAPHATVVQKQPLGTGHAARAALAALKGHRGPVLMVFADCPLITTTTLQRLVDACRQQQAAVGVLGFYAGDPSPYGRLIVRRGVLEKIVESRDADESEKAVDFCNSGVMCLDGTLPPNSSAPSGTTTSSASSISPMSSALPAGGATPPSPWKARRPSSWVSIHAPNWRRRKESCNSACVRRRSMPA
jgi:bifunctional UDP-N-acetylglucosamine pyrophosphorylase/glucosamine-1-phosphate N-acetyltransferase